VTLPYVEDRASTPVDDGTCPICVADRADRAARLAEAEVMAAAAPPFDPDRRVSDAVAGERLEEARVVARRCGAEVRAAQIGVETAERDLAALGAVPSSWNAAWWWVLGLAGAAAVGAAIGKLLPESLDLFVKRPYYLETFGRGGAARAAWDAQWLAMLIAGTIATVPMLATLVRVRLGGFFKVGLFVSEVGFAGAFAMVRSTDRQFSWQIVAYSLFEFAIALAGVLLCFAVADRLTAEREERAPRRNAEGRLRSARAWLERAMMRAATADATLLAHVGPIREREWDEERRPRLQELARHTGRHACGTAAARSVARAEHPLLMLIDAHHTGGHDA
jgi:hypothetical protein